MTDSPAADLLLEIGCEDLPARFVEGLAEALADAVVAGLDRAGFAHGAWEAFATPRRLAVLVQAVAGHGAARESVRKGPALAGAFRNGEPTPAALGFARSAGVEVASLAQENGHLVHRAVVPGQALDAAAPGLLAAALARMDELVPKRMRWGVGTDTFVRPVAWLVALHGGRVLPVSAFGLDAGRTTFGHRFHAPRAIELAHPGEYVGRLEAAFVLPRTADRAARVRAGVAAEAARLGGFARATDALVAEVACLVEWPVPLAGRFEERFLRLPPEVIVATVETNQRYFTVFADDGHTRLLPWFITFANIESVDATQVVAGNERVVRPRLADALFFLDEDEKTPVGQWLEKLEGVTFQKELGSVADKARRVGALAVALAEATGTDATATARAAGLAKADLVSRMVFEFPELQGLMGAHYAGVGAHPEPVAVREAIRDQYLPAQQGTGIPANGPGRLLALADRLDTLAGVFGTGRVPSATKDPFGLRRAAVGALRIVIEGGLELDLAAWLERALAVQPAGATKAGAADTAVALQEFVFERLRAVLAATDAVPQTFDAVLAVESRRPLDIARRLAAVRHFLGLPEAQALAAAGKRVRNILRQAGDAAPAPGMLPDPARYAAPAEAALGAALAAATADVAGRMADADYGAALSRLAALRAPVDAFFDAVMVMDPDAAVRANRLALLGLLDALNRAVADISLLPG